MQQGQRQLVDAHIVVFPVGARGLQGTGVALLALHRLGVEHQFAVAVNLVGNAKTSAFPFAGLAQQMRPGDGSVVFTVKANAGQAAHHGLIGVGQQASPMGHASEQGQIGFGHAEGLIGALRLAPGLAQFTTDPNLPRHRPARVHRAMQAVPWRRVVVVHAIAQRLCMGVAGPRHLVGLGVGDGVVKLRHGVQCGGSIDGEQMYNHRRGPCHG